MPWYKKKHRKSTKLPRDLFDVIVGYEDVKKILLKALKSKKPVHALLAGVPASAKSLFLSEIQRLPSSYFLLGGKTTKAGLTWILSRYKPKYLLIDELDKMPRREMTVLLSLMETGLVKDVKYRKEIEVVLDTKVFAACNRDDTIPAELKSRFYLKFYFKPYTLTEFKEVGTKVLVNREGVKASLASYIVNRVSEFTRDVRVCIGIARIAETKNDVDFIVDSLRKYKKFDWRDHFG